MRIYDLLKPGCQHITIFISFKNLDLDMLFPEVSGKTHSFHLTLGDNRSSCPPLQAKTKYSTPVTPFSPWEGCLNLESKRVKTDCQDSENEVKIKKHLHLISQFNFTVHKKVGWLVFFNL